MKVPPTAAAFALVASVASADPLNCVLTAYKAMPGLTATVAGQALAVTWDGDEGAELRLRFGIEGGTPTIQELAVRRKGGAWATLAGNVTPEFRVVSGRRRISEQQLGPLRSWGETITPERAAREKWDTSFFKMTPEFLEKGQWAVLGRPAVCAWRRGRQAAEESRPAAQAGGDQARDRNLPGGRLHVPAPRRPTRGRCRVIRGVGHGVPDGSPEPLRRTRGGRARYSCGQPVAAQGLLVVGRRMEWVDRAARQRVDERPVRGDARRPPVELRAGGHHPVVDLQPVCADASDVTGVLMNTDELNPAGFAA